MQTKKHFDVAVIGAGVFGSWTAYKLQRSGAKVILLDAYGPGNSRSSSGDESRIIRMGYGPDVIYSKSAIRSLELWQQFCERFEGIDKLFQKTGVLWLAKTNDQYCEATERNLRSLNVRTERLERAELENVFPQLGFDGVEWGLLEPDSGALMGRRAVKAVANQAKEDGVTVQVQAVQPPSGGEKVTFLNTLDGAQIVAEKFVFACGPWLPKLFPELLGHLIRVTRQEVFYFGVPSGDHQFGVGQMPIWVDFNDLAYAFPNLDGRGFKIAIDAHGAEFDPDSDERVVTAAGLQAVREYLQKRVPALANSPVTETRVCQYENTPNGDFIIDRHPQYENVWLVGGGSGHGFKHGPAVAEYVVEMIAGKQTSEPRFALATKTRLHNRQVF